ncbi:Nucleoside diphosphate kinase domain-containing protein [Phytophthora infestans]|uniref:Nucleoside diphosphate kinase domain-containing protein n=1 Tax=Phytophthora infestans TaxID=4787 RepID=A0A8S9TGK6_PHYIN|nr:Nucleoside diphosphate kinase domain-containing protein [Phytophthora infestans]
MDEEQKLAFFLEWDDPQSGLKKGYIMHYHGDNTVELVERKTRKIFLKRIPIPTVGLDDLYVGSSITVYSRQLTIIEPANEFTRKMLQQREDKAIFVITPDGYAHMGRIIQLIEQSGVSVRDIRMAHLQKSHLATLAITDNNQQRALVNDVSVLVEVRLPNPKAIEDVKMKLGSVDTVLVVRTGLEVFSGRDVFPTTAVLDNCTLCLIRPRIVREACVGEILDAIIAAGFEVSALKLVHFQMNEVDELFKIYKGVVRQYHEMLKYMCSSPCLALEVRGDDVVRRFREFCGPFDVQVARALRPDCLRAKFGRSAIYNALHCTDCPEDGVLECQFVFKSLFS